MHNLCNITEFSTNFNKYVLFGIFFFNENNIINCYRYLLWYKMPTFMYSIIIHEYMYIFFLDS